MHKERLIALILVILTAAASRLLPHPENVAPIAAIALFCGAKFANKSLAFIVPALALLVSDSVIGFYAGMGTVYAAFAVITLIGLFLRGRENTTTIIASSVFASILFFLITNAPMLVPHTPYPEGISGLIMSYEAALPFFRNTLLGDMFYNAFLFGSFALAQRCFLSHSNKARVTLP